MSSQSSLWMNSSSILLEREGVGLLGIEPVLKKDSLAFSPAILVFFLIKYADMCRRDQTLQEVLEFHVYPPTWIRKRFVCFRFRLKHVVRS